MVEEEAGGADLSVGIHPLHVRAEDAMEEVVEDGAFGPDNVEGFVYGGVTVDDDGDGHGGVNVVVEVRGDEVALPFDWNLEA
mmetsp:Transcript_65067/g.77024  ORF Transcript_65067/g.77024 Transcript_65067/m.77024 type:complete len:82 (+) Transcript_65067:349-594(+)